MLWTEFLSGLEKAEFHQIEQIHDPNVGLDKFYSMQY